MALLGRAGLQLEHLHPLGHGLGGAELPREGIGAGALGAIEPPDHARCGAQQHDGQRPPGPGDDGRQHDQAPITGTYLARRTTITLRTWVRLMSKALRP